MSALHLISFGFLHLDGGVPPRADRVEDVRDRLRDPGAARDILDLDGRDRRVQEVVLATPGAAGLLANLVDYAVQPLARPEVIAIGCAGGRHRSVALVELLAGAVQAERPVRVDHLHVHLPRVVREDEVAPPSYLVTFERIGSVLGVPPLLARAADADELAAAVGRYARRYLEAPDVAVFIGLEPGRGSIGMDAEHGAFTFAVTGTGEVTP